MRENGPLLSRVGRGLGIFPARPKNTFCPGWSHDPGQKGLFVPGGGSTQDKRPHPIYVCALFLFSQHLVS